MGGTHVGWSSVGLCSRAIGQNYSWSQADGYVRVHAEGTPLTEKGLGNTQEGRKRAEGHRGKA